MNTNTETVVMQIIKVLRETDPTSTKIARDVPIEIVRTSIHAIVRAVFCYSRGVTPGAYHKDGYGCKHVDMKTGEIKCGYVIGYAIYKWLIRVLQPSLAIHDHSTGCNFLHERRTTKLFQEQIADFLNKEIPDARHDKSYEGFLHIKRYVERILSFYASRGNTAPLLYENIEMDIPEFKSMIVFRIDDLVENHNVHPVSHSMNIILTRDKDLFEEPPNVDHDTDVVPVDNVRQTRTEMNQTHDDDDADDY